MLNATISHHLNKIPGHVSANILRNIYVDNVLNSFQTEGDLLEFYESSNAIMNDAGFSLEQWCTNSNKLISVYNVNKSSNISVLGLRWNSHTDILSIPSYKPNCIIKSKRDVVSEMSKLYDPFGYLLPITVTAKIFVQCLWKSKVSWDERLPSDLLQTWKLYAEDISKLSNYSFERKFQDYSKPDLHVFCDASTKAYGAVAYFVEGPHVNFIIAKSRLVPLKAPSLPQLELTALNVAAKLASYVLSTFHAELSIAEVYLWTDSKIAVDWTKSVNLSKNYVKQRVSNIRECCPYANIRHVAGSENPADLLSRGVSTQKYLKADQWLNGPQWLTQKWPVMHTTVKSVACNESFNEDLSASVIFPIIIEKYSSFSKLLRVTAYVLKFIKILRGKAMHSKCELDSRNNDGLATKLSSEELARAENVLTKYVQASAFPNVLKYLSNKEGKQPAIVNQLKLFTCDGLIRSSGRIDRSELCFNTRNPVLLPKNSHFTKLLATSIHKRYMHCGSNELACYIRERWWVPQIRVLTRSITRKCVACLKVRGQPFKSPVTSSLPIDRVKRAVPFQVTGIDYTGAMQVKNCGAVIKAYVVLFTCAITRAVHLEIVESNSEEEFLKAFIRFVSRRSFPETVYSDNAATFVSSAKNIRSLLESSSVSNYLHKHKVQWKFITPCTPLGGWHVGETYWND